MPHRLQWHEDDVGQMQRPLSVQLSSEMTSVTQACSLRMHLSQGQNLLETWATIGKCRHLSKAFCLTWQATQLRFREACRSLASSPEIDGQNWTKTAFWCS